MPTAPNASDSTTTGSRTDWTRRPVSAVRWWGLPLAIGVAAGIARVSLRADATLWVLLFAWMATGCLLNARRCHRLHCYISGPVFLVGAVVAGAVATGVVDLGARGFGNAVNATLALALLSFVPEILWKRYA